ncbi:MAG: hypothetical protein HGA36_03490 [Candidatus Moranbacteria bacterium]|nr:hypothetical protein [Candidatus Moranbacteria bacterium]
MEGFFASEENRQLYVQYYMDLHQAIEDFSVALKIELNNHFANPGKIISIGNSHLGFHGFLRCAYRLLYERPNYFNVRAFNNEKEDVYRVGILLELENFLVNLPGATIPLRPPAISAWLSLKQRDRYVQF